MAFELGLPSLGRPALSAERRQLLQRRIRWFVASTITYNVVEAIIAISEGTRASSAALIGFGLDSVIEVSSAAAVAWQFAGSDPGRREKITLRIIAFSFFALALYVGVNSILALVRTRRARATLCHWDCFGGSQSGGHADAVVGTAPRGARTRILECGR